MSRAGKRVVFVAVSNAVKASLVRAGVYPDKIMVVYNGADVRLYHPGVQPSASCASKNEVVKVAMFGRIVERKRHIDAVEALALLCHEVNARLYIVGDAWDELGVAVETRLRERVAELGLMDHVIFTGYRTDVPEVMAAMDIVLVPSLDEPFARVILEAMSMQKPVIGTFSGGTPEMIKHGINGLLVPPKNPGALFRAILQLVREPELASILSRNGRERAVNLFSIESHVMAIMRLYEKLLRAAGRQVTPVGCPKIGKRQSQLEL
jgi:glycosyltransferase involved in cell wall biosynthesis